MRDDIIKQLKNLKEIKPSEEWKKSSRDFLLMKIKNEKAEKEFLGAITKKTWARELQEMFFSKEFFRLALRPAISVASIITLVLSGGFSVSASQVALPGDTLYPLKIASERVQVALTFKEESLAKIHVELAGKRLDEVKRIKENAGPNKSQKINIAIDKFQEEIKTVKTQLDSLHEKESAHEVLEVAKIVDSKTNEYKEALSIAVNDESEEIAQKINDGIALTEQAGDKALTVIAEKQGESDQNNLIGKISEKLVEMERRVLKTEEILAVLDSNKANDNLEKAKNDLGEAKLVLASAREMLGNKNTNDALNKVMESKGLIRQAEEIVVKLNIIKEDVVVAMDDENKEKVLEENSKQSEISENIVGEKNCCVAPTKTSAKVVAPVKEEPKEIDESELVVGIDLKQEETKE